MVVTRQFFAKCFFSKNQPLKFAFKIT